MQETTPKSAQERRLLLEQRLKGVPAGIAPARVIPRRADQRAAPLSFAQRQMWVIDKMTSGNPAYNLPVGYRMKGELDVGALEAGFNEIIQRHEILRTTFARQDWEPVQKVHPAWQLGLKVIGLEHLPADQREAALQDFASAESVKRFDLTQLPLMCVSLFRLGPVEHVLLINLHHIVADGLSTSIMLEELDACYRAFRAGLPPSLPELPIQYADFAVWEREKAIKNHAAQLEFWMDQLRGNLPVLELPGDRTRPEFQSFEGSSVFFELPDPFCARLQALAATQGGTFFMLILAAFQTILHRHSGCHDIIVGVPVANRSMSEVQPLIGNFLNMIALRCDLSGDPSFLQLLRQARDVTQNAFSNKDLPFENVFEHLKTQRDMSRNPVFQVMMQVLPNGAMRLGDLEISAFHFDLGFAQFDLGLHLYQGGKGWTGRFEYCSALFNRDTVERLSGHFLNLLEQIVANPERPISRVPILTQAETKRMLVEWNNRSCDYPGDKCIHHLFEEVAKEQGSRVAVKCEGNALTYGELNARANQLARRLIRSGVTPGSLVGIFVDRSLDLLVGLLGILKAGAAYVPLDPMFPSERLAYMLADAGASTLVAQEHLLAAIPAADRKVICIDTEWSSISKEDRGNPQLALDPANLAYVIYTSGSTGKPKGVMIQHRSVVNFLSSMQKAPGFTKVDALVSVTTVSFDIAALELFLPLISGGRVVIAPRELTVDGPRLVQLLKDSGATVMQATPATWRMLIESGWRGDRRLKVLCGGEAIDRDLAERLLERCGELWNMYGPTETTIWSTTERLLPGQTITIGRPIANTSVYILDGTFQPVPAGVVGELFIGGDGVACGYLNRPELTSERFVTNPFDSRQTGRLYRTGDLARFRSDGKIEFLGRADQQVKIRGFRIELGEIEAALAGVEGVAQAIVVAREDTPGDKRLVAYLVAEDPPPPLKPGQPPVTSPPPNNKIISGEHDSNATLLSTSSLRAALRAALPDYMVPSTFVFLGALPLTPNGKVDRKALPPPERLESEPGAEFEAPRGDTEVKLAGIMTSLLQLPRVGRKDSFFDLGGHSILAVRLFNEIERDFGKRLPLATLFRAPTIEQLGTVLAERKDHQGKWASLVAIQPKGSKLRFFCVHGAGGNVLLYRDLARRLGNDYPVYGLQSQGLDGKAPPLRTVEEMAERYCREVRELQPTGPFCLGGYCLGGTIAYAMAQRLRREGYEVPLVALLDTYNFSRMEPPKLLHHLKQKLAFHLSTLVQLRLRNWPAYFHNKLRVARDGEFSSLWKALVSSFQKNETGHVPASIETSVQVVNDRAAIVYRPLPYEGRVTVFKPKVNYDFYPDPQMGWGEVALGGVEVVGLSANPHAMLVEPFVGELAGELQRQLDAVSGARKAGPVEDSSREIVASA